jgi:phospholipid/cholesterol/gamma-HCH transport system ATP-binding protein
MHEQSTAGMKDDGSVLSFREVTIAPEGDRTGMRDVCFDLRRGGLTLVLAEPEREHLPLCDAAEGLVKPESGHVEFLGKSWGAAGIWQAAEMRAKIGRVFDESGWLSNLDVVENVTLAERHRAARPVGEIEGEADKLARAFGLPGVPAGRPAWAPRDNLRRAQWIRAFLGRPLLVLLERPMAGVSREYRERLADAVGAARARGAAVLWTTTDRDEWRDEMWGEADRYAMRGAEMRPAGRDES